MTPRQARRSKDPDSFSIGFVEPTPIEKEESTVSFEIKDGSENMVLLTKENSDEDNHITSLDSMDSRRARKSQANSQSAKSVDSKKGLVSNSLRSTSMEDVDMEDLGEAYAKTVAKSLSHRSSEHDRRDKGVVHKSRSSRHSKRIEIETDSDASSDYLSDSEKGVPKKDSSKKPGNINGFVPSPGQGNFPPFQQIPNQFNYPINQAFGNGPNPLMYSFGYPPPDQFSFAPPYISNRNYISGQSWNPGQSQPNQQWVPMMNPNFASFPYYPPAVINAEKQTTDSPVPAAASNPANEAEAEIRREYIPGKSSPLIDRHKSLEGISHDKETETKMKRSVTSKEVKSSAKKDVVFNTSDSKIDVEEDSDSQAESEMPLQEAPIQSRVSSTLPPKSTSLVSRYGSSELPNADNVQEVPGPSENDIENHLLSSQPVALENPPAAPQSTIVQSPSLPLQPNVAEIIQPEPTATVNDNPLQAPPATVVERPSPVARTAAESFATVPSVPIPHNFAKTIIGMLSQEQEFNRITALHSLGIIQVDEDQRLNKITQMTSRLLGRSCCVLSLVDTDKVHWKSVSWSTQVIFDNNEEPRYESFCSWVVQEESGRGVTILDAKTDPRCAHIPLKPGLEFYAGVPLIIGGKHKVGALSIQGPASSHINVTDMNILHEMAVWASGELDTMIHQKKLESQKNLMKYRDKLSILAYHGALDNTDQKVLDKTLAIIRDAVAAQSVLLLKLVPDGKSFQSLLQAYSISPSSHTAGKLPIGEEMFRELCHLTLKKENADSVLFLENLKTGAVTKDVDQYLSKKINKCAGEIIWSLSGPAAILGVFFEGTYRSISTEEFVFIKDIVAPISAMLEQLEVKDSFHQSGNVFKNAGMSAKKHALPFGSQNGLAPCFLMIEPRISGFKGYEKVDQSASLMRSVVKIESAGSPGPKGQAIGEVLAKDSGSSDIARKSTKSKLELHPPEAFEILNDLTNMMENLAERYSLKKPKRFGRLYYILSNYGPETGTFLDSAAFANELLFSIDTYNQTKKRALKTQMGIHTDFVSADLCADTNGLKDHLGSIANNTYQLASRTEDILVSELFYHQTKSVCSYDQRNPIIIRGEGAFSTYQLIGIAKNTTIPSAAAVIENSINNRGSMVVNIVPSHPKLKAEEEIDDNDHLVPVISSKRKMKQCTIL